MRTVNYSDILRGSAGLAGMNYVPGDATSDVGLPEFRLFRTFHDRRLQAAWEIHRWPDLCPVEQRTYRHQWAIGTAYVATNEVYDLASGKYFQALQSSTGENPAVAGVENSDYWAACANGYSAADWITGTAYAVGVQVKNPLTGLYYQCKSAHTASATFAADLAARWGLLTPFNKYIAYEQSWETAIGEYISAYNKDPRITTQLSSYPFWLTQDGANFSLNAPNVLWLYYRIRRPELIGDFWDATAIYASGAQVYFVTAAGSGNFYTANATTAAAEDPTTTPAKWDVVELPYFLRGYLIEAGFADWLTGDDREDQQAKHEAFATTYLELEADKLQRQQQQVRRLQVA